MRAKLLVSLGGIVAALCDDPPAEVIAAAQDEARAVWRRTGDRFEEVAALLARVGELGTEPVDGHERIGGSTRPALARGDRLETAYLHRTIIEAGRAASIPTPINERLVTLAEEAAEKRWAPGATSAEELRHRVLG